MTVSLSLCHSVTLCSLAYSFLLFTHFIVVVVKKKEETQVGREGVTKEIGVTEKDDRESGVTE